MAQPTITDLITTLADALGVPGRIVESTARHMREAGLLPTGKGGTSAPASIEHAVVLLIGLMLAPGSKAAADMARLYSQLPLDGVNFYRDSPDGSAEMYRVDNADPAIEDMPMLAGTFGAFLSGMIESLLYRAELPVDPGPVNVSGGLGTAAATVIIGPLVGGGAANNCFVVSYNLVPTGGGRNPDDAPIARLDHSSEVPGTIFRVLSDLFAEGAGPQPMPGFRARDLYLEE